MIMNKIEDPKSMKSVESNQSAWLKVD